MKEQIGIIAYNHKLTIQALREIAENDMDSKPISIKQNIIIMDDGTRYFALDSETGTVIKNTRGRKIDQMIVVDDKRWNIYLQDNSNHIINFIKQKINENYDSCIPDEVKVLHYEW